MKLFDRVWANNPAVQRAGGSTISGSCWRTEALGPKLLGKLRIVCGAEDTFHLEEAVTMLCDFLKSKGREDVCEIVPARDHMNLYDSYRTFPDGLAKRIDDEMRAKFEAAGPSR
jgi:hypothetical protein